MGGLNRSQTANLDTYDRATLVKSQTRAACLGFWAWGVQDSISSWLETSVEKKGQ